MRTTSVNGCPAEVLLDTGTVGTNLMSLVWAQAAQLPTTQLDKPSEIRMATKNSRTTANHSAKAEVDIGKGRRIPCEFLLVPIASYDIILGMPFMKQAKVVLDTADSTATFKDNGITIRCSATSPLAVASAATDILKPHQDDHESYEDDELSDNDPTSYDYYDISEYPTFSSYHTTDELPKSNDPDLPDFRAEYPEVFPDKIPMKLPPLQPGLNHTIPLIESKKDDFRNEYRRIPDLRIAQLRQWLSEWEAAGIA